MPQDTAIVAVLILDRPLCGTCIASKTGMTENEVENKLVTLGRRFHVYRHRAERCHACGAVGPVASLARPT